MQTLTLRVFLQPPRAIACVNILLLLLTSVGTLKSQQQHYELMNAALPWEGGQNFLQKGQ